MSQLLEHINQERLYEMALVDIAFEILKETKRPYNFRELMEEISVLRKLSKEQMMSVIAQVYTEVNIDGRFTCTGDNTWGLKRWYPTETVEENNEGGGKKKKVVLDDDFDDDYEIEEIVEEYEEEDEITVFEEEEDFVEDEDEIEEDLAEDEDEEIFEDEGIAEEKIEEDSEEETEEF